MVYIGIDVGGTGIQIGVVDENGRILEKGDTPTLAGRPFEDIVRDMGNCMLNTIAEAGYTACGSAGKTEAWARWGRFPP